MHVMFPFRPFCAYSFKNHKKKFLLALVMLMERMNLVTAVFPSVVTIQPEEVRLGSLSLDTKTQTIFYSTAGLNRISNYAEYPLITSAFYNGTVAQVLLNIDMERVCFPSM